MAEAGAKLIVTGRNVERGHITVDMIDQLGGDSLFVQQDVTREADWHPVIDATIERFGRLDILLNNAGDAKLGPLTELSLDTLHFLLRVDLEGPFLGMKLAWPHLVAAGGGAIINMSSVAGQRGIVGGTAYCAVKGAQAALTRAAAMEGVAVNIRVNSMHPGLIWTEGVTDVMGDNVEEFKPRLLVHVPFGDFGNQKTSLTPASTWPPTRPGTSPRWNSTSTAVSSRDRLRPTTGPVTAGGRDPGPRQSGPRCATPLAAAPEASSRAKPRASRRGRAAPPHRRQDQPRLARRRLDWPESLDQSTHRIRQRSSAWAGTSKNWPP